MSQCLISNCKRLYVFPTLKFTDIERKMKKISEMPKNDKPREKLAKKGVETLNSRGLLMVILGKGIKGRDVTVLANDILNLIEKKREHSINKSNTL